MGVLRQSGVIKQSAALPDPIPSDNLAKVTLEFYSSHIGNTDAFTQTGVGGNGSVATDASLHTMDMSTGANATGYAKFETKKTWTPNTVPLIATFMLSAMSAIAASHFIIAGFKVTLGASALINTHMAAFVGKSTGWFAAWNNNDGSEHSQSLGVPPAVGDLISIIVTSSKIDFYLNGVRVHTAVTNVPSSAMSAGVAIIKDVNNASSVTASVDLIQIERYSV